MTPFVLHPTIASCADLSAFLRDWQIGDGDLMITSRHVLGDLSPGCDLLFRGDFGAGEPDDEMLDAMLAAAAGKDYRRIVAIGGGSVLDMAKLFVFGDGLSCAEIYEQGAQLSRKRSLIAVPTTCGTGSEVTNISIMEFKSRGTKLGLAIPALFPDEAVLIPSLLRSMPFEVFATSSIDALVHAVESFVSPRQSRFTRAFGCAAIELILAGYRDLAAAGTHALPEDDAMERFLTASTMAGIAFGNAGCGAVHAMSYPIGGGYHVPHGKANYMLFAEIFAAYKALGAELAPVEQVIAGSLGCSQDRAFDEMFALLEQILPREPIGPLGVDAAKCAEMAATVIQNQQRLLANNPVPLCEQDIRDIYIRCI